LRAILNVDPAPQARRPSFAPLRNACVHSRPRTLSSRQRPTGAAMTTYPLSEPATIYAIEGDTEAMSDVVGQGTLADCVDVVAAMSPDRQQAIFIQMDDLGLRFGPPEVAELLRFLRDEGAGLSNTEIADIPGDH
jgi:hypothetical protein